MCSVGDDNIEEDGPLKYMEGCQQLQSFNGLCKKCNNLQANIILRGKDAYCKVCFLAVTTHKFKGYLGKHRFVRPNEKILIVYKPGHPITAMLHMIRTGIDLSTHKKLRFNPIILFIEESIDMSIEDRKKFLYKIKEDVDHFKFPLYFASKPLFIKNNQEYTKDMIFTGIEQITLEENDTLNLNSCALTSNLNIKEDYDNIIERNLLIHVSRLLECACTFTTEIAVDLAAQLLTNVSLGRGHQLSLDIGDKDDRNLDVSIVRPLRIFELKELVYYNIYNNLEPLHLIDNKSATKQQTLHNLLNKFVNDLQTNYPATISTIVKTGEKLCVDQKNIEEDRCTLCQGPIKRMTNELSSAESTKFSHHISTQNGEVSLVGQERFDSLYKNFNMQKSGNYCFACNNISEYLL